jgi:hypothetical protein
VGFSGPALRTSWIVLASIAVVCFLVLVVTYVRFRFIKAIMKPFTRGKGLIRRGRKSMTRTQSRQHVRQLQRVLKGGGFDPGPIDGIFGKRTQVASEAYREFHGMSPDEVVRNGQAKARGVAFIIESIEGLEAQANARDPDALDEAETSLVNGANVMQGRERRPSDFVRGDPKSGR